MPLLKLLIVLSPGADDRHQRAAEAAGVEVVSVHPDRLPGASPDMHMHVHMHVDVVLVVAGPFDVGAVVAQVKNVVSGAPVFVVGDAEARRGLRATSARFLDEGLPADVVVRALKSEASRLPAVLPIPSFDDVGAGLDEALEVELDAARAALVGSTSPLAERSSLGAGRLDEDDLPTLFGRAFAGAFTGRLVLRSAAGTRAIDFQSGRPVGASSTNAQDRLGEVLCRRGFSSTDERDSALEEAISSGRRLGAVLVERQVLEAPQLLDALRFQQEEIILEAFGWPTGTYEAEAASGLAPGRWLRHPAALVMEGSRRAYDLARLRAKLGSPRNVWTLETGRAAAALRDAFAFDDAERRVPALFDGVRRLEDLPRLAGVGEVVVLRVARALQVFSLLAADEYASPRPRDRDVSRARVLARLSVARDGDYFEVLGVSREDGAAVVERAYQRAWQATSDRALGAQLASELGDELSELREILREAWRVLGCDRMRVAYSSALTEASSRPVAHPAVAG